MAYFPKPVRIGGNSTRWRIGDLTEYETTLKACFALLT